MPKEFDSCVAKGGRVRTINIGNSNKYMHICFLNGKSYRGEIKEKKNVKRTRK